VSSGWHALGAPQNVSPTAGAGFPSIALLPDGSPVISWNEGNAIYIRMWQPAGCDGAWVDMGLHIWGFVSTLLVTPAGQTVIAVISSAQDTLTVESWDGTAFQPLGNSFTSQGYVLGPPAIAVDSTGELSVAWVDGTGPLATNIQVARWDGASWTALSAPQGVLSAYVISQAGRLVSIAVTPSGQPVVAWPTTSRATLVARFVSGTTWTKLGTAPATFSGAGEDNGPIVRINAAGDIFLASMTTGGPGANYHVGAARFTGAAWQALGGPLIQAGSAQDYDMTIGLDGLPIVADTEASGSSDQMFTYRWTGASWQTPAPAGTAGTYVHEPVLAVDPSGRLVAAWIERTVVSGAVGINAVSVARLEP
jgi:hypothetical protein